MIVGGWEIALDSVTKTYHPGRPNEVRALRDVSLHIAEGETVALVGPSGSGKSTLLAVLGCMTRPTSGRVRVGGREVSRLPERFLTRVRRETFGFVFQQFHLVRELSVLENVALPLYPLALSGREVRRRAEEALERVGLSGRRDAKAKLLSGGEQQRAALARALVNRPRVIVADEPTAHLDSALSREVLGLLGEIAAEGRTLVLATHDPLVFENPLVGRRIRLRDGRVEGEEALR